jgi:hypothetical protein
MPNEDADIIRLASWFDNELVPPVSRWLRDEHMPLNPQYLRSRANRAWAIGEIDDHVRAYLMMKADSVLRWCWAEGHHISAWIEPSGAVHQFPYGGGVGAMGHSGWIEQNMQKLQSEGFTATQPGGKGTAAISDQMMKAGWIRYSGGAVVTYPMPNEAQIAALDQLIRGLNPPPDYKVQFMIVGAGIMSDVAAGDVMANGVAQTIDVLQGAEPVGAEAPLAPHKKADAGGGTDGAFQEGDGSDLDNQYMTNVQDGSKAPVERSYQYMKQDWDPEVWWSRNLLQYLQKSYPGKPAPGAQSDLPASGTGPGQQFASIVKTVVRAALKRLADATDPSDTDGQHDQLNEDSMETHLLDPDSVLYKGDKGRQAPTKEMRTHLGEGWRRRRSDKGIEQVIIQKEKEHKEPSQIRQELSQNGVPSNVIDETYENRDKNLFKVVEVGS